MIQPDCHSQRLVMKSLKKMQLPSWIHFLPSKKTQQKLPFAAGQIIWFSILPLFLWLPAGHFCWGFVTSLLSENSGNIVWTRSTEDRLMQGRDPSTSHSAKLISKASLGEKNTYCSRSPWRTRSSAVRSCGWTMGSLALGWWPKVLMVSKASSCPPCTSEALRNELLLQPSQARLNASKMPPVTLGESNKNPPKPPSVSWNQIAETKWHFGNPGCQASLVDFYSTIMAVVNLQ